MSARPPRLRFPCTALVLLGAAASFPLPARALGGAAQHALSLPAAQQARGELRQAFGFFYFVRQWPGTFCSTHACPLVHDRKKYRFTVHGLWPNYNGGGWPQFCDHTKPFDPEAVDDLLPGLEEVWPSYMDSRDSDSFWAHEWNKHGTCALTSLPDEHAYFQAILDLNTKYDLEVPLKAAGIVPSEDKQYLLGQFTSVIKSAYGADFDVHCTPDGHLTEVWMCFDPHLKPMDCPRSGAAAARAEAGKQPPGLQAPRCTHIIMPPVPGSPAPGAEQHPLLHQQRPGVHKPFAFLGPDPFHGPRVCAGPAAGAAAAACTSLLVVIVLAVRRRAAAQARIDGGAEEGASIEEGLEKPLVA